MATPPRQTRWCKWSCSGPALREEPAPRRSEKFWVSMVEGHMSVRRSWDTHRGPRGVTNANVFRFAAYNYQSEANWFHSCVSCVYNIPSFVVFTLFLFLFGLYPYILYTVGKTNMHQTWWHPHKTTVVGHLQYWISKLGVHNMLLCINHT